MNHYTQQQQQMPRVQSNFSLKSDTTQVVKHAMAFAEHNLNSYPNTSKQQKSHHVASSSSLQQPPISVLKHYRDQIYEPSQQIGGHLVPSNKVEMTDFKIYQTPQRTDSNYKTGGVSAQAKTTEQMMKHYEEPLISQQ